MDEKEHVLSKNESFYNAFNKQNLEEMMDVWFEDASAMCIHPGWPVLRGYQPIVDSWKDIFDHNDHMEIRLSNVFVTVSGNLAWVSCQENLFSMNMSGVQTSKVHASNLFRQVNGHWKMQLHHAAALPPTGPEEAMNN